MMEILLSRQQNIGKTIRADTYYENKGAYCISSGHLQGKMSG